MPDIVTCESCGKETYATIPRCPHCGAAMPTFDAVAHWSINRNVRFTHSAVAIHANRAFHFVVLFVCVGISIVLARQHWELLTVDPVAVLLSELPLPVLVAVWAAYRLSQTGPAVVLDRQGLHFPTLLTAPIPWSTVQEVAVEERYIGFRMIDRLQILWELTNPWR